MGARSKGNWQTSLSGCKLIRTSTAQATQHLPARAEEAKEHHSLVIASPVLLSVTVELVCVEVQVEAEMPLYMSGPVEMVAMPVFLEDTRHV